MVSIHVRPPEIDDRLLPGHWEGDFIKGAGNKSSVGVLVERSTRLALLARMDDATAACALAGFTAKLNSIAEPMRQSFTYDQGKELAKHRELASATGMKVYFREPHSPWQRGTCENTNWRCASTYPRAPAWASILKTNSTPSAVASITDLALRINNRRCRNMTDKNCVLLMTACITPPDSNVLKHMIRRSDPTVRLNDYKAALKWWLNYKDTRISGIVFVENSGHDLSELQNLVNMENRYKRRVEFLRHEATKIPEDLHYGFSELEMIDKAFEDSVLVKSSDFVIKVTGRLYFPKLSKLLDEIKDETLIITDCRDAAIFGSSKHYVLTTLFIVKNNFYLNVLHNAKSKMSGAQNGLMETLYFQILKPLYLKDSKSLVLRFPFNVDPVGVGAHWNKDYLSKKNRLISFIRGVCRFIIPNFWI